MEDKPHLGQSHVPPPPTFAAEPIPHVSQKSYRRKYLKIRHFYKGVMGESNNLIREEERMKALARRLQEQVDELQDVLLDLNDEARIPSFLRYDLGPPSPSASILPSLEEDEEIESMDPNTARDLMKARKKYAKGRYSADEYNAIEAAIVSRLPHAGPKTLAGLLNVPHTHYPADNLPEDLVGELDDLPGFMSPNHEQSHLDALDKAMADPSIYNPTEKTGKPLPLTDRIVLSDKELSLVNPVSPLNWLRKYQPQVFLQDQENASEKSSARAGGNARKRGRQSEPVPKPDHDGDDDGGAPEFATSGRGRKNKDDEPYRPKGPSGRGSKRKRDDGETGSRKRTQKAARASLPS